MNTLLPFQPDSMTPAHLAAVSYLARYTGHTHTLYSSQLRRWFAWCEANLLDPLVGIQRALTELYIRNLGQSGLMASSVVTSMHAVRGYFRYARIDGLIVSDPAVYARLPEGHRDESRAAEKTDEIRSELKNSGGSLINHLQRIEREVRQLQLGRYRPSGT